MSNEKGNKMEKGQRVAYETKIGYRVGYVLDFRGDKVLVNFDNHRKSWCKKSNLTIVTKS